LSAGERRLLHGEIGIALEEIYQDRAQEIAVPLAHHYAEAGNQEKTIEHSLRAGDQARLAYANEEAAINYQQALEFLKEVGDLEQAARTLMKLGLTHHNTFDFKAGRRAYEEGFILWQRMGESHPTTPSPPAPHALRMAESEPVTLDPGLAVAALRLPR
jgi:predicted ATPase